MRTDRDTTRIVRAWLEEGTTVLPDRVLDAVLDGLPATRQTHGRSMLRRVAAMNDALKIAMAGTAAVLVVGVGIFALSPTPGPTVGGSVPSPSPTASLAVSPTVSPSASPTTAESIEPTPLPTETALPAASAGTLAPGTYVVDDPFPVRVALTVGQGWRVWSPVDRVGAAIFKDSPDPPDGRGIVITVVDNVYADACDPSKGLRTPPLGPTVDDLATALASQPLTVASPITEVTLDGYDGSYLEYTVPTMEISCSYSALTRWPSAAGDRQALLGEGDMVWILDIEGVRVVIDAFTFPETTRAELAELRSIVESMQIGPPGR